MYCPKCGHQTVSDELRFCSYCGFKLGVIKAAVSENEEEIVRPPATTLARTTRQRDINVGVVLMFAGVLLAEFIAATAGWGLGRNRGAAVLGVFYLTLVIFSRPIMKGIHKLLSWEDDENITASQKGLGFGATLMFLSTVVLALSSFFMYGRMKSTPLFIGIGLVFALLLIVGKQLMQGLKFLVQDDVVSKAISSTESRPSLQTGSAIASLPAAQGTPVSLFGTQRVTTAEIVAPSSITEHTTNLLE